eukprot:1209391-Rhodomonas_salina.2
MLALDVRWTSRSKRLLRRMSTRLWRRLLMQTMRWTTRKTTSDGCGSHRNTATSQHRNIADIADIADIATSQTAQ